MPPSGFSKKAISGSLVFIRSCYEDLLESVRSGKYDSYEEAIEHEISQIEKALSGLHIDQKGALIETTSELDNALGQD